MKIKNLLDKMVVPVAMLSSALILGLIARENSQKEDNSSYREKPSYDLIFHDPYLREYSGLPVETLEGFSQDFYVDRHPFGSLDEVRTIFSSRTTGGHAESERKPTERDFGRFEVIEKIAQAKHPTYSLEFQNK